MQTLNKWLLLSIGSALVASGLAGCSTSKCSCCGGTAKAEITKADFGKLPDGTPVELFTLRNRKGMEVKISNYGGIVTSMTAPDRDGKFADIALGYDNLGGYVKATPFFGALIGRYGNRIAKGKFTLDGHEYTLATNNYPNALHGGVKGFDKVVWEPAILTGPDGAGLKLTYVSKDGEEGYPGNLSVTV